jgi:hypothetical protein
VREEPWHLHPKATRGGVLSPDSDLTRFAPPVDDQGVVGQCTGQAVTCGVQTTLAAAGVQIPYLDPQAAYRLARCLDRAYTSYPTGPLPPLEDVGADPNLAHLALTRWGCPATVDTFGFDGPCPEMTEAYGQHSNDEPKLGELEDSDEFRVIGQQRIYSTGQQRILDVRAALAAGFAVTMAVHASDDRFQGYMGGVMGPAPAWASCNHLVCAIGDYTDATGTTILIVQNSWSKNWGESGLFRCHSDVLLASDGTHVCSVRKVD